MSLRHVLLVVLKKQSASGYGITKWFDGPLGYFWDTSHQRVYRALATLYEDGWVDYEWVHQDDKPDKKVYSITPVGEQALQQWMETPLKPPVINDGFLVKLFAAQHDTVDCLIGELDAQLQEHAHLLKEYRQVEAQYFAPPVTDPEQRMMYLTLKRGLIYEEGALRWAQEALDVLRDLKNSGIKNT